MKAWLFKVVSIGILIGVLASFYPVRESKAFCEVDAQLTAATTGSQTTQTSEFTARIMSFQNAIAQALQVLQFDLLMQITDFSNNLRGVFGNTFWDQWMDYHQDMTAQLNTAIIDKTRIRGTNMDTENLIDRKGHIEDEEIKARQAFEVSEDSCVFDSTLPAYGRAERVSRAARVAMSNQVSRGILNNSGSGSSAADGSLASTAQDYVRFEALFCNPDENGGGDNQLCDVEGERVDEDVQISTIFDADTLEITDAADAAEDAAVYTAMVDNLLGRPRSDVIPVSALEGGVSARNAILQKRSAAAQLNLAAGIMSDQISERLPQGVDIPEWRVLREDQGVPSNEISDQPSKYEVRQGYIDFINNPKFFKRLGNNRATVMQKDVHMKALRLMLMSEELAKTERLMAMLSVQLANYLDQHAGTGTDSGP